jgi:serine/threonine protein kinase
LADDLQVEESIVFDASRIECEQTKANKLGTGSFGQVYRGTDKFNNQAIVMEYIGNGNLEEHLHFNDQKLDWEHGYTVAQEMIEGMSYLHSRGITHGDFKSANVLLTSDYHVKISDYGLSQVAASTQRGSTRARDTQAQVGTVAYRAPELIKNGKLRPSQQSDVYALGIVLWEMLTREIPFKENGTDYAIISRMAMYLSGGENPFPIVEPAEQAVSRGFYTRYHQIIRDSMVEIPEARPTAAELSSDQSTLNRLHN